MSFDFSNLERGAPRFQLGSHWTFFREYGRQVQCSIQCSNEYFFTFLLLIGSSVIRLKKYGESWNLVSFFHDCTSMGGISSVSNFHASLKPPLPPIAVARPMVTNDASPWRRGRASSGSSSRRPHSSSKIFIYFLEYCATKVYRCRESNIYFWMILLFVCLLSYF